MALRGYHLKLGGLSVANLSTSLRTSRINDRAYKTTLVLHTQPGLDGEAKVLLVENVRALTVLPGKRTGLQREHATSKRELLAVARRLRSVGRDGVTEALLRG